jgi:hypothetical protein
MLEQPSLGNGGDVEAGVDEDAASDEDMSDISSELNEDHFSWAMPVVFSLFLIEAIACNVLYMLCK